MTGQSALLLPPEQAVAVISATIVEELQPALERLEQFKALHDDWDSYGSVAITQVAIDRAREIAAEVISDHALFIRPKGYAFDVVPMPNGGVQLEWTIGAQHLEIAVGPDGIRSYLLVDSSGRDCQFIRGNGETHDTVVRIAEDMLRHRGPSAVVVREYRRDPNWSGWTFETMLRVPGDVDVVELLSRDNDDPIVSGPD